MSYLDIALVLLMLVGAVSGYKQGFLMELIALVGILLGVLIGFKLMGAAMLLLDQKFNIDESVLPYVAFGVVFIIVVVLVALLGRAMKASIDKSFLGRVDQAAGALLGLLKTAFMLSVVLWIVHSLHIQFPDRWAAESWVYPKVTLIAPEFTTWVSEYLPAFKDVF